MRSQELYLAFYVAKVFYEPALPEVALKLAERAEKYFQQDLCLRILQEYVKDDKVVMMTSSRMIRNRKTAEQIQKDEMYFQKGQKLLQSRQNVEGIHYTVMAARIE